MNTPAHVIFAAAAFARPGDRARNLAVVCGAVIPDLSLYVMVPWQRYVAGRSFDQIFKEDYGSAFWQGVFAIDNSAPLYALLMAAALCLGPRWLAALAAVALLHIAFDFPLHHNDGRAHFWPFTDWVFESPVSYWDPRHYGWLVGPLEGAMCALLVALLWWRFESPAARALLLTCLALEATPALLIPVLLV